MKMVCTCQEDFNAIPDGFCGEIEIRFGKLGSPAVVDGRFYSAVIEAYDNAVIEAYGNAVIRAYDNTKIEAYDNAKIEAYDNAVIEAHDDVVVNSYGVTKVIAYDEALIEAHDQSVVLLFNDSGARCNDLAFAYKWPISNTQYLDFFDCKITNNGTAILYKAAHKLGDVYRSHHDHDFTYEIGDVITPQNGFSTDIRDKCAPGIHCAPLEWAKNFSCKWKNRAILEVEVPVSGIIAPNETDGKCRVPWAKVLREVEA